MNLKQQQCSSLNCFGKISNKKYILYHHPNGDQDLFFCEKCFPEQMAFMKKMGYKFEVIA